MQFLLHPNLPEKKVKYVIIDYRADKEIISSLENLGITPIPSCKIDTLYSAVCGHPDMSIHHLGGADFVCEPTAYDYYMRTLAFWGVNLIKGFSRLTSTYPYDIAYNVARVSNSAFHKTKFTDDAIMENSQNVDFIDVAQGYSKCSVCVVSQKAIITDDDSIFIKACANGIDALKICKGGIHLNGFEYGFFGGATGLISRDTLAVTGNVEKHMDYKKIDNFCKRHGVKLYSLTGKKPVDIGSIIPIAYG